MLVQRSDMLGLIAAGKRIAQLINDQGPWLDPANFFLAKARGSRAPAAHAAGGSPDARHDVGASEECSCHGAGAGEGDIDGGGEAGTARAGEIDGSGAEGDTQAWDQAGDEHPRSLSPGSKLLQESRAWCAASIRQTRCGTHAAGSLRERSSSHAVAPMVASAGGEAMPPRSQEGVARVKPAAWATTTSRTSWRRHGWAGSNLEGARSCLWPPGGCTRWRWPRAGCCGRGVGELGASWVWATEAAGWCQRGWGRGRCLAGQYSWEVFYTLGLYSACVWLPHAGGDGGGRGVGVWPRSARPTEPQ
jgi:hypothetical protein